MKNLTLIIPAKFESESLPNVLNEIKFLECKKKIILETTDFKTIESVKNHDCELIYQNQKGYGNALRLGIKNVDTDYLCIFNADGSFDPKYLRDMLKICINYDYVFASRYLENGGSDDDTIITRFGNYFFSTLGNILFSLKIKDILFTYILGKKNSFQALNLKSNDFCLCVEIPINAKRANQKYYQIPSKERKRIAGKKKVNEFRDGLRILIYMVQKFLKIK